MAYFKKDFGLIERLVSTASSGGSLALANNSRTFQQITGTLAHTVVLPQANAAAPNDCPLSLEFTVMNRSTGVVTVNYFGGSLAKTLAANTQATFRLVDNTSSTGTWDITNEGASGSSTVSLSSLEKLGALSALSNSLFQDSETTSTQIKVNPEEIGGNYWTTKSVLPFTRSKLASFTLNGFVYSCTGLDSGSAIVATVSRYSDDANYWLSRAAVATGRNGARGVADARGYISGGHDGSIFLATVEAYNDTLNSWSAVTGMLGVRQAHAGALYNSSMYVSGGYNGGGGAATATTEFYSVVANAWYSRSVLPSAKAEHNSLPGQKFMYSCGGVNSGGGSASSAVEIYNDVSNSFSSGPAMPTIRYASQAFLSSGSAYLVAGSNFGVNGITNGIRLEFDASVWSSIAPVSVGRFSCEASGAGLNGYGYVIAGTNPGTAVDTVEIYSPHSYFQVPITKKSTTAPTAIFAAAALNGVATSVPVRLRSDGDNWKYFEANKDGVLKLGETLTAKFQPSGQGAVFSGGGGGGQVATGEIYNHTQNIWATKASVAQARLSGTGFQVYGKSYVTGGYNLSGGVAIANHSEYDTITNVHTNKASLPAIRAAASGASMNSFGYVFGGEPNAPGGGGSPQTTNYQFNTALNSWATKAVLLSARAYMGAFVLGHAYICGGNYFTSALTTVDRYSDITDSWLNRAGLSVGRHETGGMAVNGFGYALAGYDTGGPLSTSEKYNQATNAWSSAASLITQRGRHSAFMAGGQGYICGGETGAYTDTTEQFNDAANVFTSRAVMSESKSYMSESAPGPYYNYQLQVGLPTYLAALGGAQWVTKASMITGSSNGGTCGHIEGRTFNTYSSDGTSVQYYTPATDAWSRWTNNPVANSSGGMMGFNLGGLMYSINRLVSMYAANFATGTWTARAADIFDRFRTLQPQGTAVNGYGYVYGGDQANSGTFLNHADRYDQSLNSWLNRASTSSSASRYCGGFTLNSSWYIKMGDNGAYTIAFESYNDAANNWTVKANYPTTGGQQAGLVSQGYALSIGGYNGSYLSATYRYNDSQNSWLTMPNDFRGGYINGCTDSNNGLSFGGDTGSTIATNYQYVPAIKNIVLGAGLRVS